MKMNKVNGTDHRDSRDGRRAKYHEVEFYFKTRDEYIDFCDTMYKELLLLGQWSGCPAPDTEVDGDYTESFHSYGGGIDKEFIRKKLERNSLDINDLVYCDTKREFENEMREIMRQYKGIVKKKKGGGEKPPSIREENLKVGDRIESEIPGWTAKAINGGWAGMEKGDRLLHVVWCDRGDRQDIFMDRDSFLEIVSVVSTATDWLEQLK